MKRMVIAGGSGFLGRRLADHFTASGWDVAVLTRAPGGQTPGARECHWDGSTVAGWQAELDGADAIINLAGKSVNCRYNEANRREILDSRVNPTRAIGEAIAACSKPPHVWLNASTATIYKHTLGDAHDESGPIAGTPEVNDEFSVEVAQRWETALEKAVAPRTRKVALRASMVLGLGSNSVFPTLRRLTKLGLGGRMGSGRQSVSWIHERDFCRAVDWILGHPTLSGPVNVAAPNPVSNAELMRRFREAFSVPVGLPATRWMLEIGAWALGTETELMLKSRRVVPRRLLESGFVFEFNFLEDALRQLKGSSQRQQ